MPNDEVILEDRTIGQATDADAIQQEGQMITFSRDDGPRNVVDPWSSRIASVRTSDVMIRQLAGAPRAERSFASRPISLRPSAARRAAEA